MSLSHDDIEALALLLFKTDPDVAEYLSRNGAFDGGKEDPDRFRRVSEGAWDRNEGGYRQLAITRAKDMVLLSGLP